MAHVRAATGGQCRSGGSAVRCSLSRSGNAVAIRADGADGADVRKPYSTCRTLSESIPEHRSERICGRAAGISAAPSGKPRCRMRAPKAGLDGAGADRAIMNVTTMRVVVGHSLRDQVPRFYS